MRIGQLGAETEFSVRSIRFYEQSGILPAPERIPSGYRSYDQDAVHRGSGMRVELLHYGFFALNLGAGVAAGQHAGRE
jgi:DNA-binding transcriptional MerR regulator